MRTVLAASAIVLWFAVSLVGRQGAPSCCADVSSPCAAHWNSEAVFAGRVDAVKRSGTERVVSFSVLEAFRGVASSSVEVSTGPAGQLCSLSFRVGHEYIVYADRSGTPGQGAFRVSPCSRTRPVEDAAADLAYARELKQGNAPPGYISGQVLIAPRDLAGSITGASSSAPSITVNITREGASDTVVTDAAGVFRVESRGPGSYHVNAHVPDRFYSDAAASQVTLVDSRACATVTATLHDNGHVAGRVVDASGRPVAGLTIELAAASSKPAGRSRGRRMVTDREGRYRFARLPRGRFVLSVPAGPSRGSDPQPSSVYFPGVDSVVESTRLALAPGERASLPDFRIPARHRFLAVSGVVFDSSGRPAEGARVYLKGVGDNDRIVSEPVTADFMGAFVIAARAGGEYQLFAERIRPGSGSSRVDSSDPVQFAAGEGLKPVRLTLERRY
jgi:Carboxypeptidase regulatory-like domain